MSTSRLACVVLPLALLTTACSTNYTPATGPKINVVMSGGSPAYYKNGETISYGFVGSGLVEAVEDDPEALDAAETFRDRQIGGLLATVGALVCGAIGIAVVASDSDGLGNNDGTSAAATGALVCMLGGLVTGMVLIMSAQPYQWDAINIYNDHVDQRLHQMRCSPYYCPHGWQSPYAPRAPGPGAKPPPAPARSAPAAPPPPPPAPPAAAPIDDAE